MGVKARILFILAIFLLVSFVENENWRGVLHEFGGQMTMFGVFLVFLKLAGESDGKECEID